MVAMWGAAAGGPSVAAGRMHGSSRRYGQPIALTFSLTAILQPSWVYRIVCRTRTTPSIRGDPFGTSISVMLLTAGSSWLPSIVGFNVRCKVPDGSSNHNAATVAASSPRPVAVPVAPLMIPFSVNSST